MTISSPPPTSKSTGEGRDALASLRIDRNPPKKKGGRKWIFLLGLVLLGAGGYFGYPYAVQNGWISKDVLEKSEWMPEMMQNRIDVRLSSVKVQKGRSADAVVVATGYLQSHRQAKIGARAAGMIAVIDFEEGDVVKKGELLAELEHKDIDASLAASGASVARAKAALEEQKILIEQTTVDWKRAERLWKARSFSKSEYDQARFSCRSAIARKDSLEAELELSIAQKNQTEQLKENMFIRAPFDGTIISKDAEVGESILPGGLGGGSGRGSVATIADLADLEIECDVQEDYISRITEGQETDIAVDAVQDKKYHGVVRKVIPMGDRARATIKVQVVIKDADSLLFPEMAGTVYFLPTEKELQATDEPRMFCDSDAVQTDEGDEGTQFVWVVDSEKRARKLVVKAGEERDGRTEILEGLEGKERVVVNPSDLKDGTLVKVVQ